LLAVIDDLGPIGNGMQDSVVDQRPQGGVLLQVVDSDIKFRIALAQNEIIGVSSLLMPTLSSS
jgi:hypothetical protein